MLDLTKFTEEKEVVVPIVDGWGKYRGRKYQFDTESAWYIISLPSGIIQRRATPLEILEVLEAQKKIQVYALGTEGIPLNFDNFKQKGLREAETVNFMDLPVFSVASAVIWEDNRLYFYEHIFPRQRDIIEGARESFERRQTLLGLRGTTPELRYYVLLAGLQRETYESLQQISASERFGGLSGDQLTKQLAQLRQQFDVRLKYAIEHAGGSFIRYAKRGNGYTVTWKIGTQTVVSDIRDDMRIISAGFCLSGADKEHTMNSIVNLAKLFQEDAPLYITRE